MSSSLRSEALAALSIALSLTSGCASAPAQQELTEHLARAVASAVRLDHEVRFAAAHGSAPPDAAERARVHERLNRALQANGLKGCLPDGTALSESVEATRNALIEHGYVFLPTGAEPGLALARVTGRTTGLRRELWGRTVRYRRLVHEAPLVPDYPTFVALRSGEGGLPPAGRFAGPTVYLDRDAIARRAGRGVYADLDPVQLADYVELAQAASLFFAGDVAREEQVLPQDLARASQAVHVRVLLTLVRYGHAPTALRQIEWFSRGSPGCPAALGAAARFVAESLRGAEDPPAAAEQVWERLRRDM